MGSRLLLLALLAVACSPPPPNTPSVYVSPGSGGAYGNDGPRACRGPTPPGQVERAKAEFGAGRAAYQGGDYARAVQFWRAALQSDCNATRLLLNLSQAEERMGDRSSAAQTLRLYLEREPSAYDRPQVEARIRVLESR